MRSRHGRVRTGAAALLLCSTALAQSAPFQWDVGAVLETAESKTEFPIFDFPGNQPVQVGIGTDESEFDRLTVDGLRYFEPIVPAEGPLARAPFLARASWLGASAAVSDSESRSSFGSESTTDTRGMAASAQFVSRDSGWLVGGFASYSRFDAGSSIIRSRILSLEAGRYLSQRSALRIGAQRLLGSQAIEGRDTSSVSFDTVFAELEVVGDLGADWDYALDVTFRLPEDGSEVASLALQASVFPTPMLEFGTDVSVFTANPKQRARSYGVFGRWFITDAWSGFLRYGWQDEDRRADFNEDVDFWTLSVRRRF